MKNRLIVALVASALAALALAGCTAQAPGGASSAAAPPATVYGTDLATASTSIGTVIVDDRGMTAYVFDNDTPGEAASACTGACAKTWPAITTTSSTPTVTGVTGTVGTITTAGGAMQVTVDGLPLYTYVADSASGDTKGQGVGGTWWAVGADGNKASGD